MTLGISGQRIVGGKVAKGNRLSSDGGGELECNWFGSNYDRNETTGCVRITAFAGGTATVCFILSFVRAASHTFVRRRHPT